MKVVLDKGAHMPEYAHPGMDAGADLRSPVNAIVPARGSVFIDTGVHIELPLNTVGILKSKSGLCKNHGITTEGGVIDCGYVGSIGVTLHNHSDIPYVIDAGDKITQLLILPVIHLPFEQVDKLEKTDRSNGGFGSTGR